MKISGVYKITNTVTNDCYIGSSKNIKRRWAEHKRSTTWKKYPNNPMYLDMKKYGVDKFEFQILEEVESEKLKETEQQFIEKLQPTYNNYRAKGWDIERYKECNKECKKRYIQSKKGKEHTKKYDKDYRNQLCSYNGEILTLDKLRHRFTKDGIEHPVIEAKKYLLVK